jgi:hypothetical protein
MSELQEIVVIVAPDGTTRIEIRGINGPPCLDVIRGVGTFLGGEVLDRQYTDEFYQQANATQLSSLDRRER